MCVCGCGCECVFVGGKGLVSGWVCLEVCEGELCLRLCMYVCVFVCVCVCVLVRERKRKCMCTCACVMNVTNFVYDLGKIMQLINK